MSRLALLTTVPPSKQVLLDDFAKPSATVSRFAGASGGMLAAMALRATRAGITTSSIFSLLPVPRDQGAFKMGQA
jgi:hypothetical protein